MGDIIEQLGFLAGGSRFRRIYENLQIGCDKIYKDAGYNFKSSWFPVYYVLYKAGSSQTVMEITEQISFSHITVKNILRELEGERLIRIDPNPDDKRSKLISLSPKGLGLIEELQPLWSDFANVLKVVLTHGHPDMTNILTRIDSQLNETPINERFRLLQTDRLIILDYQPGLKSHFQKLAKPWLLSVLEGELEEEDKFTLLNPETAYVQQGGFLFYAKYKERIVGCVALKRLDEHTFEFAKLFVDPNYRQKGIATALIERCISRCKENEAKALWLQTTMAMPQAHRLYFKLGFEDADGPLSMHILKRTERIMRLSL